MKYIQKYFFVLSGILAFIFYLTTIAPSVIQIDTGELATVQATLGIAHPTGYPLFTILGYIFSLLPLPFSKIFQLNLLAAIYCSIAVSIFTYTSKLILDNLSSFQNIKTVKVKLKKKKGSDKTQSQTINPVFELSETINITSAILSGLFLALSRTFWFQSTSVEVYSLHLLLITLIILSLIKAFLLPDKEKLISSYWIIFAITLALGFTNHMTTLLIIPGVAYLYFTQNGIKTRSFKQIIFMLLILFPILILFYAYLPIRASQNPGLNWGNPVEWERIIRHITGQQYQVWLFSSTEAAAKQFNYFIGNLPNEFSLTLIIVFVGLIVSFLKARRFFIFNIIVFISTVLYSINYDINDIDSYFLLAYISLSFFAVFGILQIILFAFKNKIKIAIPISLFIILAGIQFYSSYATVNQRNNYVYQDYTKALLNSVPKNSIVFSYQWDYFISASYYFQLVENFRKDVTVIDKELFKNRTWYFNQLSSYDVKLFNTIKRDYAKFVEALVPFEREENYNGKLLGILYQSVIEKLILKNISNRDFFIAPEIFDNEIRNGEFRLPQGYTIVPHLFLFKVVGTNEYVEAPLPSYNIRFENRDDKYIVALKGFLSSMLIRRAMYELQFNKIERAGIYTKKIITDFPDVTLPPALTNLMNN